MIPPASRSDIISYRCEKALSLLKEVEILIGLSLGNSAVNRMYYACYHAVSALLLSNEIDVKTHKGLRQTFGASFVKTGLISPNDARIFSRIYDKRQASDYDDFMDLDIEEVKLLQPQINKFVELVVSMTAKEKE